MDKYEIKIVLIGDPFVGKTSLKRKYMGKTFQSNYIGTIGVDFSTKTISTSSYVARIAIWDIAGQTSYLHLRDTFYSGSFGALAVYDVTDPQSFGSIPIWVDRFLHCKDIKPDSRIVIVGNKIDLTADIVIDEAQQDGIVADLQKSHPKNQFSSFRTSALTGIDVDMAFYNLIQAIITELVTNYSSEK